VNILKFQFYNYQLVGIGTEQPIFSLLCMSLLELSLFGDCSYQNSSACSLIHLNFHWDRYNWSL